MSLGGVLLGLINIGIVIAILVLIGLVAMWILQWLGMSVPQQVQKVYLVVVALIALYMIVALLLGIAPPIALIR